MRLAEARELYSRKIRQGIFPQTPKVYSKKKENTQDAHEAIRPTSVLANTGELKEDLTPDLLRLYDLIWKRFVACQMQNSVSDQITLLIDSFTESKNGKEHNTYQFRTTDSTMKFKGFLILYDDVIEEDDKDNEENISIPEEIEIGDMLELKDIFKKQHFTNPPPRYTESSLIKQLDNLGIGRPSTYAMIVSTIINRTYVNLRERKLYATELGETVNKLLSEHFNDVINVKFTAQMEEELDKIAEGELQI